MSLRVKAYLLWAAGIAALLAVLIWENRRIYPFRCRSQP